MVLNCCKNLQPLENPPKTLTNTRNYPTKKENQINDSLYLVAETRLERATSGL